MRLQFVYVHFNNNLLRTKVLFHPRVVIHMIHATEILSLFSNNKFAASFRIFSATYDELLKFVTFCKRGLHVPSLVATF